MKPRGSARCPNLVLPKEIADHGHGDQRAFLRVADKNVNS